jgi:hypothetical protein
MRRATGGGTLDVRGIGQPLGGRRGKGFALGRVARSLLRRRIDGLDQRAQRVLVAERAEKRAERDCSIR